MTKTIEEQLKKCVYADLSNYDNVTNTYHIPKYNKPQFNIGGCYLIKLPKEIINNHDSILATNWNNGLTPQYEYYQAYVNKFMGKYMYVDCRAYDFENKTDINSMWSGWLEITTTTLLNTIN